MCGEPDYITFEAVITTRQQTQVDKILCSNNLKLSSLEQTIMVRRKQPPRCLVSLYICSNYDKPEKLRTVREAETLTGLTLTTRISKQTKSIVQRRDKTIIQH